jgi:hypothetical protein
MLPLGSGQSSISFKASAFAQDHSRSFFVGTPDSQQLGKVRHAMPLPALPFNAVDWDRRLLHVQEHLPCTRCLRLTGTVGARISDHWT